MNNLRYIFDKDLLLSKGQTDPLAYVRQAFQTLFQRPVEQQQIFNTIWNNLLLRQSLFITPNIGRPDAESTFVTMVNTMDNRLFQFITVH